jgi:hypothetical protein
MVTTPCQNSQGCIRLLGTTKSQWHNLLVMLKCILISILQSHKKQHKSYCSSIRSSHKCSTTNWNRTYIWGSAHYASSKFYSNNFKTIEAPAPFKWIWKAKISKKVKISIWLMFKGGIKSRNVLKRKNYKIEGDDYSCDLCNLNIEECTDTSFSGAYLAQIAGISLVPMES